MFNAGLMPLKLHRSQLTTCSKAAIFEQMPGLVLTRDPICACANDNPVESLVAKGIRPMLLSMC